MIVCALHILGMSTCLQAALLQSPNKTRDQNTGRGAEKVALADVHVHKTAKVADLSRQRACDLGLVDQSASTGERLIRSRASRMLCMNASLQGTCSHPQMRLKIEALTVALKRQHDGWLQYFEVAKAADLSRQRACNLV